MVSSYNRRNTTTRSILGLSLLATAATALPRPGHETAPSLISSSSVRKSLNWGLHAPATKHSLSNPSGALTAFNSAAQVQAFSQQCSRAIDVASCVGRDTAIAFVEALHPTAQFQLVDGYTSKHNGVFHAHFLEVIDGKTVSNGNLNVNVDTGANEVLSYGDSSYASVAKAGEQVQGWKEKVAGWANHAEQVVLHAASGLDDGPQGQADAYSSPPLVPAADKHQQDPRHGLLSFLSLASTCPDLSALLASSPRADLVDAMSVTRTGDHSSAHTHVISNTPTLEPVKASLVYLHDGAELKMAWKYEILSDDNQYEAYVSADPNVAEGSEETLMVVDWVRDFRPTGGEIGFDGTQFIGRAATKGQKKSLKKSGGFVGAMIPEKGASPSYRVFPWGVNAPDEGKRETLTGSLVELDNEASPSGWHSIPSTYKGGADKFYGDTRGNNVWASDNPDGGTNYETNYRPSGGPSMSFDFPLGWPKAGTPLEPSLYINASVTELFYTNNEIHDLFYRYGFDEVSGNFQAVNFGKGGLGGDAVTAFAQDGGGMNNANFATPPDGQKPRMRMYSWSGSEPYRDGDFEAGIVIHEYSHGISTRLTGGPANSGCLGWGEAGGMGEGWGDFFATMIRMHTQNVTDYNMGEWASSRVGGIRNYPYSTSLKVNLDSYKSLDKPGYWGVHAIGEVWAEMLYEMAVLLIAEHGFHSGLFPPASNTTSSDFYVDSTAAKLVPKYGNTLAVQLVVDGLKLQPCRPSFQDARDAILEADMVLTKGANACLIWKAFAKRGLGPDAAVIGSTPWGGGVRTEDHTVPKKCIA